MQNTTLMRRIAAMLYDALLILAVLFLSTLPFIAVRDGEPVETTDNLIYQLVLGVVIYVFFVGFWIRSGRTLGMQSWRLQLQSADGGPVSFGVNDSLFCILTVMATVRTWFPLVALGQGQTDLA